MEILQAQEVTRIYRRQNYHSVVTTDNSEYSARALLISTGSRYRRLGVSGESDYIGAGVHFCANWPGPQYPIFAEQRHPAG